MYALTLKLWCWKTLYLGLNNKGFVTVHFIEILSR